RDGVRLKAEARREGEGAALPRLTVHGDLAAHQGGQPGGNGQTQAGAAVLARGRCVLLLEGTEDARLLLPGDADAGVADLEMQKAESRRRKAVRLPVCLLLSAFCLLHFAFCL